MTFREMKKIVVDTLNCDEDKAAPMEASLTEDLQPGRCGAEHGPGRCLRRVRARRGEVELTDPVGHIYNYITAHV